MIRATEVRIGGLGLILAVTMGATGGCNPASTGSGKAAPALNASGQPDGQNPQAGRPQPVEFLGGFVKALSERKVSPDSFTAVFKEKLARPKYMNEQHEKLGYDPDKFNRFLEKAAAGGFDGVEAIPSATGTYFASMGKKAGKAENCVIRLVPTDDAAGWRVDWLHRSATVAPVFRDDGLTPLQMDARIAAIAFLSTTLDGQFDLAEALMTNRFKTDLAFSTTDSNKKLGYDSALLQNVKLREWKGNSVEFTITKQEIAEGKPAVIAGERIDAGMLNRKPFTLTLTKEANGQWLVDKFESK
jgi:hypothetical protein